MSDILVQRFPQNPILTPSQVQASRPELKVESLLNPGAFFFEGRIYLIVRVAERPKPVPGRVRVVVVENNGVQILDWDANDPELNISDPREYKYRGNGYLSTLSHLRLFVSDDGINFLPAPNSPLVSEGMLESFGIEDCRVTTFEDGRFFLSYTAVSSWGYGVGLRETKDWLNYTLHGMILPPPNKDAAIFDRKIGERFFCLHRPSGIIVGGHYIWLCSSSDLKNWGGHRPVARTRPGMWDSSRIGAGTAPIYTEQGWLELYHGADENSRYCLGALLLDLKEPWKVLARSQEPLMEPLAAYEREGFFGNVVFTNGHVVDGDVISLYYGASDSVICGAKLSLSRILQSLGRNSLY